jgi:hypothetical protein
MNTQPDELAAILGRLQSLERQNRLMKVLALAAGVAVGCGALMAADGLRQKTLEVQKLVLSDAAGKPRCLLEVDDKGNVVQSFRDANETERIRLIVDQDGIARIRLFDDAGSARVAAVTFPASFKDAPSQAGLSVLGFGNKAANSAQGGIFLRTTRDGVADEAVFDKTGKLRVSVGSYLEDNLSAVEILGKDKDSPCSIQLGTLDNGTAFQQFFGSNGKRRILLNTGRKGDAAQFFFDSDEKNRLSLGVSPDGVVAQNWLDKDENSRMRMVVVPRGTTREGIGADGYAAQLFFDKNGKLRVDTSTYGDGQASTDFRDVDGNRRLSMVMFANSEGIVRHFDGNGVVRQYSGTYATGESGHAILGKDGTTKFSTMVNRDGSLSYYQDKDAATKAWEATGNVLQILDLGERLGIFGGRDR